MTKIADIRTEYKLQSLAESDVAANPVEQFSKWWDAAIKSNIDEVNAMTLATATPTGKPFARIVLLKGFDEKGFSFYTNYESDKGLELASNPQAALLFFWKELQRQVRIEGTVEKLSAEESDVYFASRPEGSRIGAWASPQSKVVSTRNELEESFLAYEKEFKGKDIPRPPHWGGYRIVPKQIEFWQGRPNRLHDRIQYSLQKDNNWKIERLAP
ncbi:pyridoxamine 5'-phosphate oxidase [Ferruginibacter albus]|uniref:pyridoxamine 5'-phosphate oxidase n=1 Tax=Ferruginibacter albus TaxID=2875540 RepID=UPI001CC350C4|nr:pyridoxamine 5'-phosphate oxidase [Ferruginibacter albus]UAY52261.1 pyridoxamine 5'-phosphate oxidase [Ferruginibacter albus]